jgi:hypothetical protein
MFTDLFVCALETISNKQRAAKSYEKVYLPPISSSISGRAKFHEFLSLQARRLW